MAVTRETLRLVRDLRVTVGIEADDAVRDLTKRWVQAWDDLAATVNAGIADLVAKQATLGRAPRAWELARLDRLRRALQYVEASLIRLASKTGSTVTDAAGRAITATTRAEPSVIASQLPASERAAAAVSFDRVPAGAIDAIVRRVQQRIVSTSMPLSTAAYQAVQRELVRGVAAGLSPDATARAMLDRVRGAFDGGLVRATVISRTETLDAYRLASRASHMANSDMVRGWVWTCSLDRRCCPSCWSKHGSEHPVDELGPNDHHQGRCARTPLVRSWADLGFRIDEPASQFPDARKAFDRLPKADQLQVMGPERLELLRTDKVAWSDLSTERTNPGWRTSFVPTPLADLRRNAT